MPNSLHGLTEVERAKAELNKELSIVQRYASHGTSLDVLEWLEERVKLLLGTTRKQKKTIADESRKTGRVIRVKKVKYNSPF